MLRPHFVIYFILLQVSSKNNGLKEMHTLAINRFYIPGENGFPLNAMYAKPTNRQEEGMPRNVHDCL